MYNGEQSFGAKELRLSDSFILHDTVPSLELIAKVVDINPGSGEEALARSSTLQGYSHLISEIRNNINTGMTRDKAIVTAIDSCISQGVLVDFLTELYMEVSRMLNWEYDADAEKRVIRNESREEGRMEGLAEGLKKANTEIARKLKKAGIMSTKEIAELTGLSISEIDLL